MQPIPNEALLLGTGALTLTIVLSFPLGLERRLRLKNVGVKAHALVRVGSCLFTLTSVYEFIVPETSTLTLDPPRLAVQIASGIGPLDAGVILVSNDTVKGLITAATVQLSAAIGAACGAGLGVLAVIVLALHFPLTFAIGFFVEKIPSSHRNGRTIIRYESTRGVMRKILVVALEHGYAVSMKSAESIQTENDAGMRVTLRFESPCPQDALMREFAQIEDITAVDRVERAEFD